jgi:hypothetical protein
MIRDLTKVDADLTNDRFLPKEIDPDDFREDAG